MPHRNESIVHFLLINSDSNGIVEETIGVASMVSYLIQVDLGATTEVSHHHD